MTNSITSRQKVLDSLEFKSTGNIPRQLWALPYAEEHHSEMVDKIRRDFPEDISGVDVIYSEASIEKGDPYKKGRYTDSWGCVFTNITDGIIGEVKDPVIPKEDYEWDSVSDIHIPEESLSFDIDQVNRECEKKDEFILSSFVPRPFEQLQFIRGTESLYMDLTAPPKKMLDFMKRMHDFYCSVFEKWAKTDVDGLYFMDDWGSQNDLLIDPAMWTEYFAPMYKDYIDIAHSGNKKAFMHSDGNTLKIIPQLISFGLDAMNTQIFCIGLENLSAFKGKLTFWGEIDRQNMLPYASIQEIDTAVKKVYDTLWDNGGCIAQCEFGPGADPKNIYQVFKSWKSLEEIVRPGQES